MSKAKNKVILISRYSVFLSAALLSAGAVVAAAGAPDGQPKGRDRPGWPSPMGRERPGPPLPGERVEAELAYIKTALKLTDRQMPAWQAMAEVLRAGASHKDAEIAAHRAARTKAQDDGVQAVDPIATLEDRQHALTVEAGDLAKLLEAFKPFYAVLTAEQRENAEDLLPMWLDEPPPMMGPPRPCSPPFIHEFP
jgi:hypothetical protein